MIQWKFYLDDVLVDEPIGWNDINLTIKRDEQWQGLFFEASTSTLGFYGDAADTITEAKNNYGFNAEIELRVEAVCGQTVDILTGQLDFGTYQRSCGNECIVYISVEKSGCTMKVRNRYDQKVDLTKITAFDNFTNLVDYPGLNFTMQLAAQELETKVEGLVAEEGDSQTITIFMAGSDEGVYIRPLYGRPLYNSLRTGQLDDAANLYQDKSEFSFPLSPQLLYDDTPTCFQGDFTYNVRMKGTASGSAASTALLEAKVIILQWDGEGNIFTDGETIEEFIVDNGQSSPFEFDFDITLDGTTSITPGNGVYAVLFLDMDSLLTQMDITYTFDPETYFLIEITKSCPATDATVSLVNETGSRIAEAITDGCLRMKSDYYGRTDSQPYQSDEDGCGALRVLTSGLRLRNAENPTHFMSLRDFFLGLRGIDNVGMTVEPDEVIAGREWLRIEPVEYFYQDTELLRCSLVPNARFILESGYAYSVIKTGYQKWEVESFNGLDEFNSNREYRTSLSSVDNTLDIQSPFVAGGYPIEVTRQQQFADTGGADTTYDNDNFIICVDRTLYGYEVEQGNITDATNIFSPTTAYNWRIRPYYNLMRWWKSLAQSYNNLTNTASKLFFSAGTGNLLASGQLVADPCKLEVGARPENDDLDRTDFAAENLPIFRPERITFNYPFSLADYNTVKSDPYGYVLVECNGTEYKGYILSINYRPSQGSADFNLVLKWD